MSRHVQARPGETFDAFIARLERLRTCVRILKPCACGNGTWLEEGDVMCWECGYASDWQDQYEMHGETWAHTLERFAFEDLRKADPAAAAELLRKLSEHVVIDPQDEIPFMDPYRFSWNLQ